MTKTKADLIKEIAELKLELKKETERADRIERDYRTYKALKSGQIGVGAVRNTKAK